MYRKKKGINEGNENTDERRGQFSLQTQHFAIIELTHYKIKLYITHPYRFFFRTSFFSLPKQTMSAVAMVIWEVFVVPWEFFSTHTQQQTRI